MLPDYATSAFHKFYCNGRFPLAFVILSLHDFPPVRFADLVKKRNHFIGTVLNFAQSVVLACEARCKPDIFGGSFMSFCINLCGSSGDYCNAYRR